MTSFNEHLELPIDEFLEKNKNLANYIVYKHFGKAIANGSLDPEELYNLALIGMMKAYENYDPQYKTKFSTYAVPMMTGEIQRFIRDYNPGVRYSRSVKDVYYKITKYNLEDESIEKIASIIKELHPKLKVTEELVKEALEYKDNKYALSLEMPINPHSDTEKVVLGDTLPTLVDNSVGFVEEMLCHLNKRERYVFDKTQEGYKQHEIAKVLNTSQVQVSRIHKRAKEKLKMVLKMRQEHLDQPTPKPQPTTPRQTITITEPQGGKNMAKTRKGNLEKAIELLKETDLTYKQIVKQTGVPLSTVGKYGWKTHRLGKNNVASNSLQEEKATKQPSPEMQEAIKLLKTTSLTYKRISERTGVHASMVGKMGPKYRPKNKRNKVPKNNRKTYRESDKEAAIKLLKETRISYKEIAKRTGLPEGTVGNLAQKHRPKEVRDSIRKEYKEKYIEFINQGNSAAQANKKASEVIAKANNQVIEPTEGDKTILKNQEVVFSFESQEPNSLKGVGKPRGFETVEQPESSVPEHITSTPSAEHITPSKIKRRLALNFNIEGTGVSTEELVEELTNLINVIKTVDCKGIDFKVGIQTS